MSIDTEMVSTHMSEGYRSPLRGSIAGSTLGPMSPRGLSQDLVASFTTNKSTSNHRLHELRLELDYQCLQIGAGIDLDSQEDPALDVNSVKELAVSLSGALNQCGYPGRCLFETLQLRALISSLALLHSLGVTTLATETWDKLKAENIPARFGTIAFQSNSISTLAERIRYTPNGYLIQLASQYLSFFRRGDSNLPSIIGPAIRLVFAGIALGSGQYHHTQQILEGLNQLFALRQRPQTKYESLCGLQEYTRLAVSMAQESNLEPGKPQLRKAATVLVSALLSKLEIILVKEDEFNPPKLGGQWPRVLATCQLGPPHLDRGWYFWGVLDCASQLTSLIDPRTLGSGISKKSERLLFESKTSEYRWKAIEILLSSAHTREQQYEQLKEQLNQSLNADATKLQHKVIQETMQAADIIREQLNSDERAGLRFCLSPVLADESPLNRQHTWSSHDYFGSDLRLTDIGSNTSFSSGQTSSSSSPNTNTCLSQSSWHEEDFAKSRVQQAQNFSIQFPSKGIRKTTHTPHSAGLSEDCKNAFFYDDTEISVFRLSGLESTLSKVSAFPSIFRKEYKDECILSVAATINFVFVITNKRMVTIGISKQYKGLEIDSTLHGAGWDPSGLACYECYGQLVVLLGQFRGNHDSGFKGRIKLFKCKIDDRTRPEYYFTIPLPEHDWPKLISYEAERKVLACVTGIHNRVLAWQIKDDLSGSTNFLSYQKNRYAAETEETGITSISIYKSPSQRFYILCTTAPSSERWRNKGEWSFIIPLPLRPPATLPTQLIHPTDNNIHNFEQFEKHRALLGGCVSIEHSVFAVLEKTGKISLLSLDPHSRGGVYSAQDNAELLSTSASTSLCEQKRSGTSAMRFEPEAEGGRLIAVDARGKIVVTKFVKE
ncbi:hypothetical protein N7G274_000612 [Stereocaulon virgatum]|uniref:Uncharacterized protein n=1 Tax=Stereocaulon virgatum TaxID=373712 RepID=A0ABR4ARU0_9LECA